MEREWGGQAETSCCSYYMHDSFCLYVYFFSYFGYFCNSLMAKITPAVCYWCSVLEENNTEVLSKLIQVCFRSCFYSFPPFILGSISCRTGHCSCHRYCPVIQKKAVRKALMTGWRIKHDMDVYIYPLSKLVILFRITRVCTLSQHAFDETQWKNNRISSVYCSGLPHTDKHTPKHSYTDTQ